MNTRIIRKIFYVYLAVLALFLIVKTNWSVQGLVNTISLARDSRAAGGWNINLVPFRTIGSQVALFPSGYAMVSLFGNILLFIPMGILYRFSGFEKGGFIRFLLLTVLYILLIECIQFVSMLGSFDVDDIILNVSGALIGYAWCKVLASKKE